MSFLSVSSRAVRVRGLAAAVGMSLAVPFANTVHAQTWGQYGVNVYTLPQNFSFASNQSVNNFGQVAGVFSSGGSSTAGIYNVLTGTTVNDLFNSPSSGVGGINNLGQIVGSVESGTLSNGTPLFTAMLYNGSTSVALPSFSIQDYARAINDNGLIVGESRITGGPGVGFHAVAWNGGSVRDLGYLPDVPGDPRSELNTQVVDVNNAGVAVGYSADDNGISLAVVFDAAGAHSLDPTPAGVSAINNSGVMAGTIITDADFDVGAFYRDATGIHLLPSPGLIGSFGSAIDDSGRIFGTGYDANGGGGAALWENGGSGYTMYSLDAILDAHTSVSDWSSGPLAVSDNGEFVSAFACYGPDQSNCDSFVFQAVAPEPSTIVLTGSGLLFVIGVARWRSRKGAERVPWQA